MRTSVREDYSLKRSWNRMFPLAVAGTAAITLAAACSGQLGGSGTPGQVELTIAFWGDFGLDELEEKYETENPNVNIVLNTGDYAAQHDALQQSLVAGSGAPDIAAIDEGFIVQFRSQATCGTTFGRSSAPSSRAATCSW
ncbi:MAG TPA: hypothetical protein VFY84_21750 [Jiangellales bacterium]|nr:hypothetical protein [Jiangellales bacterium]